MGDSSLSAAGKRPTELKLLSLFPMILSQNSLFWYVQGIWAGTLHGWRVESGNRGNKQTQKRVKQVVG